MKLKNNISFDGIIKSFEEKYGRKYTENQLKQLRLGYEHNVNILIYSHPQFSGFEMQEIRLGLENNIDVTQYAYWNFDCVQQMWLHNFEPLDSVIRDAVFVLGPYYVN